MSKHRDIDEIFKEGLEDYKAKSDSNLEKKMASLIGISSIGGGGAAGGAGSSGSAAGGSASGAAGGTSGIAGSAGSGVSAITGSGTSTIGASGVGTATTAVGTAGKVGLISKSTSIVGGLIKAVGVKVGLVAKSLGIIKTVTTVAVVGGTTAVVVNEVEDRSDAELLKNKSITKIEHPQSHSNTLQKTLELQPTAWLCCEESKMSKMQSKNYCQYIKTAQNRDLETPISNENYNLLVSNDKYASNYQSQEPVYAANEEEKLSIPLQEPENIIPKSVYLDLLWKSPVLLQDSLELTSDVPQPKTMNSLEKGFYLHNYNISAGVYISPMMAWQLYENSFVNDSVTSYSIEYAPQISWAIGAEFRIQKKRNPWFAQVGISYQNLNVKSDYHFDLDYVDWNQSYWNIDTINYEIVINPPNIDTLLDIDSSYYYHKVKSISNANSIDHYHSLEVPIKMGYQYKKYGKPLSIEAAIGIAPSILISASGQTYHWSAEIRDFTTQEVKPQWNFYAIGHLGFNYQYKNTCFFIRPSFKYQLKKTSYSDASEKNQYFIFGTQFGIRFKLFNNAGQP